MPTFVSSNAMTKVIIGQVDRLPSLESSQRPEALQLLITRRHPPAPLACRHHAQGASNGNVLRALAKAPDYLGRQSERCTRQPRMRR